ncbi:hypothetical protein [Pedobacter cryoconitis]|uniref:Lipoprotein n=1 Tax=Pedobacter cryoconitis TaxID=188932 RepID=A0A7X0J4T9_9SPHI|nr:hypothetical protein [Pedobacter cryoconitis]MBB6499646.1 hypothetical protein [Pedobacter cryoconitis]
MKNIKRYSVLAIALISIVACKKTNNETTPNPVDKKIAYYNDSVSFTINEKQYVLNNRYSSGIGNQPLNIKSSPTVIEGGKLAYQTGGYYWYGAKDSTLYSVSRGFQSSKGGDDFEILFTKKFNDSQLQGGPVMLTPKDYYNLFKLGKQSFAVDLEKENTMDGISIKFRGNDMKDGLTSNIPGFSILIRSGLKKDIQDNSNFEITRVEKLGDNRYLVEAKFEINLFNNDAKLYRLKEGFLRITTRMTAPFGITG